MKPQSKHDLISSVSSITKWVSLKILIHKPKVKLLNHNCVKDKYTRTETKVLQPTGISWKENDTSLDFLGPITDLFSYTIHIRIV